MPQNLFNLGGSNIDIELLSYMWGYEFNIIYLTLYSILDLQRPSWAENGYMTDGRVTREN